jgi:RNA polymerase sigma-70 factor (ECF subfamily)
MQDSNKTMSRLLKFRVTRSPTDRFEALMRPHFKALHRSARRFAWNDSDAEDLVQDVCMKAYAHFADLEKMEHQRAWLLRVLYHTFVDSRRGDLRSPTYIGESIDHEEAVDLTEKSHLQPDEQVDRMMRVERVLGAMALLDKELCSLLAMHDVDGLSIEELAAITDLPEGTIKSRLFRTRTKLGRLLKNKQIRSVKLKIVGGRD